MRYVVVDPEGATRARFGSLREVREWAQTLREHSPDLADELLLMTYDAHGTKVGASHWLTDFVPDGEVAPVVGLLEEAVRTYATVIGGGVAAVDWSGTAMSTSLASRRSRTPANDTLGPEVAETVAG
jgi:hypothetical protein